MLMSHEEYHVIVITNLPYFKTIKNKMDNNVQFMVVKRYGDFEALHKTLSERFPATIFPDLPRKVLLVKDSTPQQRRQCFDNLMRFIASNKKVCCSNPVLTFLGVKPEMIQKVEGEDEEKDSKEETTDGKELPQGLPKRRSKLLSSGSQQSSLFSDEPEDEFDFFQEDPNTTETNSEDIENGLFTANSFTTSSSKAKKDTGVLLFSDNIEDMTDMDNAGGIYLPLGAEDTHKKTSEFLGLDDEDDKDLLNIEDDLDQLLSDVIKKPERPAKKPSPKSKPSPANKSSLSAGKPTLAQRPVPAARATGPGKTPPKPAPRRGKTTSTGGTQAAGTQSEGQNVETMDDGDILKYIQENAADEAASLDLF
ncbi:HCLS1-binding protein 3-like isoform X2 [Acanthaster planci]|nr:HCLS1-binding protein 3-like isoform X2 [Acanthaster planci]